jgi:predicted permease
MSILGGAAGLLVAVWALRLVEWVFPTALESVARLGEPGLSLNGYAFGFAAGIALLTTFMVGVVPALRLSRAPVEGGVLWTARTTTEAPRAGRLRSVLVMAQIALALVLLVGAGLLIRSVDLLQREPLGFSAEGVVTAKVGLYSARYQTSLAAYASFIEGLVEGLERQPGVLAAGVSSSVPFGGGYTVMQVRLDNAGAELANGVQAQWRVIGGDYLTAMGIPLKAGRMFDASDNHERPVRVTIINEALAERLWPGQNPIGRHMLVSDSRRPYEVVGVTPSSRMTLLGRELEPAMYFHYPQFPWSSMTLAVRVAGSPQRLDSAIRNVVATLDPEQPVADVRVLSDLVADAASSSRMTASLASLFAALALVLAAIGVYGLMSYAAAQRTGEIGIRLALGARPSAMFRLIWMQGLRLGGLGLLIGIIGAAASSRALVLLLYQVSPIDPLTYGTVFCIMTAVTLAACYVPARRAMRIDPSTVLRHE